MNRKQLKITKLTAEFESALYLRYASDFVHMTDCTRYHQYCAIFIFCSNLDRSMFWF